MFAISVSNSMNNWLFICCEAPFRLLRIDEVTYHAVLRMYVYTSLFNANSACDIIYNWLNLEFTANCVIWGVATLGCCTSRVNEMCVYDVIALVGRPGAKKLNWQNFITISPRNYYDNCFGSCLLLCPGRNFILHHSTYAVYDTDSPCEWSMPLCCVHLHYCNKKKTPDLIENKLQIRI